MLATVDLWLRTAVSCIALPVLLPARALQALMPQKTAKSSTVRAHLMDVVDGALCGEARVELEGLLCVLTFPAVCLAILFWPIVTAFALEHSTLARSSPTAEFMLHFAEVARSTRNATMTLAAFRGKSGSELLDIIPMALAGYLALIVRCLFSLPLFFCIAVDMVLNAVIITVKKLDLLALLAIPIVVAVEVAVFIIFMIMLGAGMRYLADRRAGVDRKAAQDRLSDVWAGIWRCDLRRVEIQYLLPVLGVAALLGAYLWQRPI